jgi:tRNA modification GTPase
MFRHALRSKAFSSLRRPAAIIGLGVRPYSWAATAGQHGLGRKTVLQVKPGGSEARRGIGGLSFGNDTIYALSSAQGRAGIAVIRISGPGCADVSHSLSCISLNTNT